MFLGIKAIICILVMEEDKATAPIDWIEDRLIKALLKAELAEYEALGPQERHNKLLGRLKDIEDARVAGLPLSTLFRLQRRPRKRARIEMDMDMNRVLKETNKLLAEVKGLKDKKMTKNRENEGSGPTRDEERPTHGGKSPYSHVGHEVGHREMMVDVDKKSDESE